MLTELFRKLENCNSALKSCKLNILVEVSYVKLLHEARRLIS